MVKLTDEQRVALQRSPEGISREDTTTNRVYVLVDEQVHRQAMLALKQQQDLEAIRRGVAQMEAGGGIPIQDARIQHAQELGFSVSTK